MCSAPARSSSSPARASNSAASTVPEIRRTWRRVVPSTRRRERSSVEPVVRLIPLGGLGEIGLNMMLIESGEDLIAVDCGLMFPDDELPGIDHVIPDFSYALARRDGFRGVLLTHGHEDHIGALPYLLRAAPVPVYGTAMTLALVGERLREHGLLESADLRPMRPRDRFDLGPF